MVVSTGARRAADIDRIVFRRANWRETLIADSGLMKTGPKPQPSGRNVVASDTKQFPHLRDPDVQLMMRVKQGDDDAFTQLVKAYQDRLVSVFRHVLNEQSHAEDLAQEVFLRIYRARSRYRSEERRVGKARRSRWSPYH